MEPLTTGSSDARSRCSPWPASLLEPVIVQRAALEVRRARGVQRDRPRRRRRRRLEARHRRLVLVAQVHAAGRLRAPAAPVPGRRVDDRLRRDGDHLVVRARTLGAGGARGCTCSETAGGRARHAGWSRSRRRWWWSSSQCPGTRSASPRSPASASRRSAPPDRHPQPPAIGRRRRRCVEAVAHPGTQGVGGLEDEVVGRDRVDDGAGHALGEVAQLARLDVERVAGELRRVVARVVVAIGSGRSCRTSSAWR